MKHSNRPPDDPSFFHILMGEPDESCEICRAHGLSGHDIPEEIAGMMIVEMGPLEEILCCSCPLCSQLHFESFEEPRHEPLEDDPDTIREP